MNELVTLGLLAAGAYFVAKKNDEAPVATQQTSEVRSAATTQEQAVVDELRSQGQLVTGVVDYVTPAGQTVSVVVAPTPDVPNRGVVLNPDDLARIQGRYVPQFEMTQDIQDQLNYLGYASWQDYISNYFQGRVWFYGPAADRIKFTFRDWEHWRTVNPGGGGSPAPVDQIPPELWDTKLNQEQYSDIRYKYNLYPPSLRGLGCSGCMGCSGGSPCPGRVWAT